MVMDNDDGDAPPMAGDVTVSRRIASRPNPSPAKAFAPAGRVSTVQSKDKKNKDKEQ
jgi:hypothetical protein